MEPPVPFENYARPRPLRTYSHKAKAASSNVLPLLRTRESPSSLVRKHQHNFGARDEDDQIDGVILEEANACQPDDDFEDAHELEFEPQYASDTSQNPEDYATEDDASLEYSTDEYEDEGKTPEQLKSTPPSLVKSSSSNKYLSKPVTGQSNRLRRRPFLLFDKLPPRGFKRLKPKAEDSTTSNLSAKYKLGDGFSKDEAKPNGLVQLGLRPMSTRKPHVESKIGSLDLTQSTFQSSPKRDHSLKQATMKKKKRDYDNSFLPDPKRAERQRKRQKQLKKDDPLKDKELLPPAPVPKPKMVLTSAILGDHSGLAEKPQHVPVVSGLKEQQKQTQDRGEDIPNEETSILQQHDEEGDFGAGESTTREESVELGEFPVNGLSGHSAFNHQQEHQQEQKATQEQQEDSAELHSDTISEKPVQEPAAVAVESVRESPKKLLKQPLEKPSEEPVRSPADGQKDREQVPIHAGENDPKPVIITVKESASDKANSNSDVNPRKTRSGTETFISPVHTTTTTEPTRLISHDGPREQSQHRQSKMTSQEEEHDKDEEAPTNENTSPGSGWETYVSETDIHHTPTPPRPPLASRAKSAIPVTSRGEGSWELKRSNSAV